MARYQGTHFWYLSDFNLALMTLFFQLSNPSKIVATTSVLTSYFAIETVHLSVFFSLVEASVYQPSAESSTLRPAWISFIRADGIWFYITTLLRVLISVAAGSPVYAVRTPSYFPIISAAPDKLNSPSLEPWGAAWQWFSLA